jgi:hypothetical protein
MNIGVIQRIYDGCDGILATFVAQIAVVIAQNDVKWSNFCQICEEFRA